MAKTDVSPGNSDGVTVDPVARPVRVCDVCGGVDNHPRHVISVDDATPPSKELVDKIVKNAAKASGASLSDLLSDLYDRTLQLRHMDCCRSVGCPSGDCDSLPDIQGSELLMHIKSGGK